MTGGRPSFSQIKCSTKQSLDCYIHSLELWPDQWHRDFVSNMCFLVLWWPNCEESANCFNFHLFVKYYMYISQQPMLLDCWTHWTSCLVLLSYQVLRTLSSRLETYLNIWGFATGSTIESQTSYSIGSTIFHNILAINIHRNQESSKTTLNTTK